MISMSDKSKKTTKIKMPSDTELLDWLDRNNGLLNRPDSMSGNKDGHVSIASTTPGYFNHYYGNSYRLAIIAAILGESTPHNAHRSK
jgi:hypothetical protein